jgi:hypothetical protein
MADVQLLCYVDVPIGLLCLDDLDSANMTLLALYVGVMSALLPPLLSETSVSVSSAKLEMAGTLQVLVLVLVINFWLLVSSVTLASATTT